MFTSKPVRVVCRRSRHRGAVGNDPGLRAITINAAVPKSPPSQTPDGSTFVGSPLRIISYDALLCKWMLLQGDCGPKGQYHNIFDQG